MIVNKVLILLLTMFFNGFCLFAQDDELELLDDPASSISALIGSDKNTIKKVRLISESERTLSIEVSYKGFDDKNYKIKGMILSSTKKPLKEVEAVIKDLPQNSSTIEMRFDFKQNSIKTYTTPYIGSRYLSLNIYDTNDSLGDLDLGGVNVFGNNFTYKLDKKWRISGGGSNTNIVVKVKLVPYKSARTIKP